MAGRSYSLTNQGNGINAVTVLMPRRVGNASHIYFYNQKAVPAASMPPPLCYRHCRGKDCRINPAEIMFCLSQLFGFLRLSAVDAVSPP
jgi:hypothetical protein